MSLWHCYLECVLFNILNLATFTSTILCHSVGTVKWRSQTPGLLPGTIYFTEDMKAGHPLRLYCYKELLLSSFAFVKIGKIEWLFHLVRVLSTKIL